MESFAADMKKLGKPVDTKIYPDAGHAFENPKTRLATAPKTPRTRDRGISISSPGSWAESRKKLKTR